jgi:alanine racemase
MGKEISRPVWAEINLDHMAHNMREVRRLTQQSAIVTAVIKADGYGHGAVEIAQTLLDNGADRFAVATLSEAIQLRKKYPETVIMVMGYTPNYSIEEAIKHNIVLTVFDTAQGEVIHAFAKDHNETVTIHIKLDTGMSRLGFSCSKETIDGIYALSQLDGLYLEGLFTHFACADEKDKTTTHLQMSKYNQIREALENKGVNFPICHVCNSAGIIDLPEYHLDMVRAGIMLYGLWPSPEVHQERLTLKEVMSLKAQLAHVKVLEPQTGISYGHKYQTVGNESIGTLPLGYADGYTRLLTFKAKVLIHGNRLPIVGRICMDQCMVGLQDVSAKQGDEVVLFGAQGDAFISIDEIAANLGTINYEVVCMINKRVPRHYVASGREAFTKDAVLML